MNREKKRNLITLGSLILITALTFIIGFFVRGYRLDINNQIFQPTGLLATTSIPEGAQVWVNDKLKTATNETVVLSPDNYQIEIKKPGFTSWRKEITIKREVVTEINVRLFPIAPDLRALSFTGASQPQISPDGTRLVYFVPPREQLTNSTSKQAETQNTPLPINQENQTTNTATLTETKTGLWLINLAERPLSRSFQPRVLVELTPGFDFEKAVVRWSPDSRKIMMIVPKTEKTNSYFLFDTNQAYDFTTPPLIGEKEDRAMAVLADWQKQEELSFQQAFEKLPEKLQDVLANKTISLSFSPDETRILYQAKEEVFLPERFITREIISASTQKESRQLKPGYWYVYNNKEDKNFLISDNQEIKINWLPTSRHLLLIKDSVSIEAIEYDGHNQTAIYSGPFVNNYVFPFPSGRQLLILASLNKNQPPDLYSVSLE